MKEQFIQLRQAGCPWLWVDAYDVAGVTDRLLAIDVPRVECPGKYVWDFAAGLRQIEGDGERAFSPDFAGRPAQLLKQILTFSPGTLVIFQVPSPELWRDIASCQALANLRDRFKTAQQMLVLVSRGGAPPDLVKADIPILKEELPHQKDLEGMIRQQLAAIGEATGRPFPVADEQVRDAACYLRGMTAFLAENVFASKILDGTIDMPGLKVAQRETIESATNRALTFERQAWTFAQIGGMEQIVRYGKMLFGGQAKPSLVLRIDEIDKVVGANATGAAGDNTGVSQDALRNLLTYIEENNWGFMLLAGCPGAGKSLFTICLGNEYGVVTLAADLGRTRNKYVGESEAACRMLFDSVKAMGNSKVLVVATANRLDTLPPELLSRASGGIWYFDAPSEEELARIWEVQLHAHGLADKELPPHQGWVGRDVRNCCRQASALGVSILDAAPFCMNTGVVSKALIADSRKEAEAKGFLSASSPGPYRIPKGATKRSVSVNI